MSAEHIKVFHKLLQEGRYGTVGYISIYDVDFAEAESQKQLNIYPESIFARKRDNNRWVAQIGQYRRAQTILFPWERSFQIFLRSLRIGHGKRYITLN